MPAEVEETPHSAPFSDGIDVLSGTAEVEETPPSRRRTEETDDEESDAFFENAISDEEDGACAQTHKASHFDRQPNKSKSIMMVGKSVVQRLDRNSSSIKKVLLVFVPFALALALTNFGSAIMLIKYLKTTEVGSDGNLVGVGGGSPIVATRGSTETFVLEDEPYDVSALSSNRFLAEESPALSTTLCPVGVAEKIFQDCEESISVHLKKQCRSGTTRVFALCGSGGGAYSTEDDNTEGMRFYSYNSMDATVVVSCPLHSEGDDDTCEIDFEPTMPTFEDEPCECDYECESGFCDLESSTCTDYESYLGGLNITDDTEANSTQTQLQTYLVMADSLITYEAFDELKPFLQNTTASSCEGVMEEFANQLGLSLDDLSSIQDYLFSDDQINEIADFCEALEDGTVLPFTHNADSLATTALSENDVADLLKQIQDMASEGQVSSEDLVESLVTGRRRLTATNGNITYSGEMLEALFENVDPFAMDMVANAFAEKQDQILREAEAFRASLAPANTSAELHNVFFEKNRFLLQDSFRSGPSLDQRIEAVHKEHAKRRASRVHHKHIENVHQAHRVISSYVEQFSHHRRRLATDDCDQDEYNCGSDVLDGALLSIESAFDVEVFQDIFDAVETFGNVRDGVDDTSLVVDIIWIGLSVAEKLPIIGPAFKPPYNLVNLIKKFVDKIDKKLTDAEKKIVKKIDEALGSTVNRTAEFVDLLDGAAGTLDLVGDVLTMTCNAELIDQITGVDFMSSSAQSVTSSASDGMSAAGHSIADALEVVNDMVATDAWSTFERVLGVGEDFAQLVGPLINPLSPITDLLKTKIKMPWPGKIKKKENLGKVACSPASKVGYSSKKGTFGDKCWETCPRHFDELKGIIPKCRPQCKLNYYKSTRNIFGCSNPRTKSWTRKTYTKSRKAKCKSGYYLKPFTRTCAEKCPSLTIGSKCATHYNCNGKYFMGLHANKYCKPKTRNKRWHRSSCDKYGVPARIDISNNCMKKCLPGEKETPIGLCVELEGHTYISPADVIDMIAKMFELVGKIIMAPIEATIGRLLESLFNALLSNIPGVPAWLTNALPEVKELPSLPSPPSLTNSNFMGPINDFVANAEKIVNIPEDYLDQVTIKIPELPALPSASDISATFDDYLSRTPFEELTSVMTSLLGMVSGCKRETNLQVPSLISLFKTLDLPGASSWKDCKIDIPVCSQLDFGDASAEKIQSMDESFSPLLETITGASHSRRRKLINLSELTENWNWLPIPINMGSLLGKLASKIFPDTMDTLTGKKAHLGSRTNILGKGQIPLSNLGTDKATFNQYFVEYELVESIMTEIGFRKPENEKVQFDLRVKAQVGVRLRFSRIQGSRLTPTKFREMLQNSFAQNRAMVQFLRQRTMGVAIRTEETFDDPLEVAEEETKIPFQCIEGDSIPFACNTRASYCDIACDHLLRLQNGPVKGPETRGHDCSATYIASRINSLKDAEWGEEDIVKWATSCSSAYNRIYTDAYKYVDGRKTSKKSFKRTLDDYIKAKYGDEEWTDYEVDIYGTSTTDAAIRAIKALEIDFPISLFLTLFPNLSFPGYSMYDSTSGVWEGDGAQSATGGVRWLFGLGMGWTRLNGAKTRENTKGSNLFSKMTENLDEVGDVYFKNRRKELTLWFSLEKSPKLADIWLGKITGSPALDTGTLMPYAETDTFNVMPAKAVFYPIASLRNCISGTGKCSGLE